MVDELKLPPTEQAPATTDVAPEQVKDFFEKNLSLLNVSGTALETISQKKELLFSLMQKAGVEVSQLASADSGIIKVIDVKEPGARELYEPLIRSIAEGLSKGEAVNDVLVLLKAPEDVQPKQQLPNVFYIDFDPATEITPEQQIKLKQQFQEIYLAAQKIAAQPKVVEEEVAEVSQSQPTSTESLTEADTPLPTATEAIPAEAPRDFKKDIEYAEGIEKELLNKMVDAQWQYIEHMQRQGVANDKISDLRQALEAHLKQVIDAKVADMLSEEVAQKQRNVLRQEEYQQSVQSE